MRDISAQHFDLCEQVVTKVPTQAEAARVRSISQERIRKLVQQGRLNIVEIGGRKFVGRSEVEVFAPLAGGIPRKKSVAKKAAAKKKRPD
ncbi:hypothetical protein [Granulicella sp. L46]|uniref:hypothetical protein n=1 Tax=Granulicella sp. L46 TaxID=1641865 RepID=UPI00131DA924|nr:hypothetical protein [Granulicella sp. L46]